MSPELTLRQYTINFQAKLFYELIFNTTSNICWCCFWCWNRIQRTHTHWTHTLPLNCNPAPEIILVTTFQTESYYVVLTGLELTGSVCHCLPGAGLKALPYLSWNYFSSVFSAYAPNEVTPRAHWVAWQILALSLLRLISFYSVKSCYCF